MKYFLFVMISLFIGCQSEKSESVIDRYAHIKDERARDIIKASIEHAGGIDTWERINRLTYTKDFSLLLGDGSVEKKYEQVHDYGYQPLVIDIKSQENGDMIHTVFSEGTYSRTKNGDVVEMKEDQLRKAVNTSTYVIGMPFKMLDPGAAIKYIGQETLENGRQVHVIEVAYNPDLHPNHSTPEVWKYYFDVNDFRIVGNWVQSSDHANIVENLSFDRVGGILFNKERKSYRLDSLGKKEYLRAHYFYTNYKVE